MSEALHNIKPPATPVARMPVHAESLRVGIRLAIMVTRGQVPSPQVIEQIIEKADANVCLHEFPIRSVISGMSDRRRLYATKAMEMLLHHTPKDSLDLTQKDMDIIVDKAWHLAGAMERADMTAQQIDTLELGHD